MIGTPVGKYRLILKGVDITRSPACDPTTPEGPRPLDLLKLDVRFLGFVLDLWSQKNLIIPAKNPNSVSVNLVLYQM